MHAAPEASTLSQSGLLLSKLRDYPPIIKNQMEKNMENETETGGI